MLVETGMSATSAFVLVGAASAAFVAGGAMVYSALLLSLAQPLPLVVALSTSTFLFLYEALAQLFHHTRTSYAEVLLTQSPQDTSSVAGLSQLFTIMTMMLGGILLYTVDALIYRVSLLAANCYGEAALPQRQHHHEGPRARGSLSTLDLAASAYGANLHTSSALHLDYFQSAELPDISTTASPYGRYTAQSSGLRARGTILSAIAVSLHHIPEGLALYVAAVRHLHIGVAVALGVVLHSLPDGIALASSIYFASGRRLRGVFWCVLSPVGKLSGAVSAWLLMGPDSQDDQLKHALATGIAAGVLIGVGVKEVMPTTHVYAEGKAHGTVLGVAIGVFVIAATRFISI